MDGIKEKLLLSAKEKQFLETVYHIYLDQRSEENQLPLINAIVELHNSGDINITSEFMAVKSGNKPIDFFHMYHIFEKIIPAIDVSVSSMVECVNHLEVEAGNDLMAGSLISPFVDYCKNDITRCREALTLAANDKNAGMIPGIINAGTSFNIEEFAKEAIALTCSEFVEVRRQATYSIGIIDYKKNDKLMDNSLRALEQLIESEKDEFCLGSALRSLTALYSSLEDHSTSKAIGLIKLLLHPKRDIIIRVIADILWRNKISEPLFSILVNALKDVKADNKVAIDYIDYVLANLIESNKIDQAIDLLEHILIENNDELDIEPFDSFIHSVLKKENTIINRLVTRWFLSGKISQYRALEDIINYRHDKEIELAVDKNLIESQDKIVCFFVLRKAVGWLFDAPISTTSFIISMIEYIDKDDEIIELLFYPVLLNYPQKTKDYVLNIIDKQTPRAQQILKKAIDKLDEHFTNLKVSEPLLELLPCEKHQDAYMKFNRQQFSKSYEEAERKSPLLSIFPKSVLLYGHKYVSLINNGKGKEERVENSLHSLESSVEYPQLLYLDPHRLDYTIRCLRGEEFIR